MSRREFGLRRISAHDIGDLIDRAAVRRRPRPPLLAIDRAEVAVLVGPFVPDAHAVVVEIFDVGVAAQEPQQFVDDGFDVQLLGGDQRETARQVKAHLVAEDRARADAGAVALFDALGEHAFHQVEILAHGFGLPADSLAKSSRQMSSGRRVRKSTLD